jgi:hypothetical protein
MTLDDWWTVVEVNPEAETRKAFAVWLIDEANDPTGGRRTPVDGAAGPAGGGLWTDAVDMARSAS